MGTDGSGRGEVFIEHLDVHGWVRQVVVLGSTASGVVFGLVFAWRNRGVAPVLALMDLAVSVLCLFLGVWAVLDRRSGWPRRLLVSVLALFFFYLFMTGGGEGHGVFWGLTVPGTVFFILGFRDGLAVVSLYFAALLAGYFLLPMVPGWRGASYPAAFMARYLAVYGLLAVVTAAYEYLRAVWAKAVLEEAERRTRAEAEARRSAELLAAVVDSSPLPLFVIEAGGLCRSRSRSAEPLALSPASRPPDGLAALMPRPLALEVMARLRQVRETGEAVLWKTVVSDRTYEVALFPLARSDLFGVFMADRTEEQRLQEALVEAKRSAEEANAAKSRFLAVMSHEIRTPVSAILAAMPALEGREVSEPGRSLAVVRSAAETLQALIDDILDLARIEAGRLELVFSAFGVRETVEDLLRIVQVKAEPKSVVVRAEVAPDVPSRVVGDGNRVRQVLLNLLGNAVKFTPAGEVVLRVETVGRRPDGPVLRFRVSDTGIGIPEDKIPVLFDRFVQVDGTTSRRFGGTGLGLAIVKELTEAMGGEVSVESRLGEGSVFTVVLPFREAGGAGAEAAASKGAAGGAVSGRKVLVVDDTPYARESLVLMLKVLGYEGEAVESGREALEALAKGGYGLVILDIRMPEMDGFETFRRIRERGWGVPVMALTADALPQTLEGCRRVGMDDVLTKPFRMDDLREAVRRLCR